MDHEGRRSADISKLIREIRHKRLPFGYSFQRFDKGRIGEALELVFKNGLMHLVRTPPARGARMRDRRQAVC
jgi:hypothetical protein